MPLPENSRITIPKFTPESVGDHYGNNRELDRWAANLPFFRQYTKIDQSVGLAGNVTFNTVDPAWAYFPYTGSVQIVKFKKFEPWTSINVRVGAHFKLSNNHTLDLGVRFTGSAVGATSRNYWVNGMYGASSSIHHMMYGEITINGYFSVPLPPPVPDQTHYPSNAYFKNSVLGADTYTVDLIGRVSSGATATLDQYDNCFLSIIETY